MSELNPELTATIAALALEHVDVPSGRSLDKVVLRDVQWRVDAGDFWAVTGFHRSGKSDLMLVVAGILPPTRGVYRVFGQPWISESDAPEIGTRLRLGLVFDGGQLFQHLNVAENVALPLAYHRSREFTDVAVEVGDLLQLTGLTHLASARPAELGRNWQQRVGLARALALRPEILLLDSPLSGLDPQDAAWWLDLLGVLRAGHPLFDRRAMTLIVTGDDWRPWRDRASHFAVLRNQTFLAIGNRENLAAFEQQNPDFLRASPVSQETLAPKPVSRSH